MEQSKIRSLMGMAKSLQSVDLDRSDYWRGFQRGIRRRYHGENFGTSEEHEEWMNCAQDEYRKQLQTGYRAGYYYGDLHVDGAEDIQPLRKLLLLSVSDLAEIAAVSARTVEGWEQSRPIEKRSLLLIQKFLMI